MRRADNTHPGLVQTESCTAMGSPFHPGQVVGAILLAILLWFALPTIVQAATIVVNSTADNTVAGDGACTLREAINNANADADTTGGDCVAGSGADTIQVPAGTYSLMVGVDDTNVRGDLDIQAAGGDLTIVGAGRSATLINGPGLVVGTDRILHIAPAGAGSEITVTVRSLTLRGGNTTGGGGAIYNAGATLLVDDCEVADNVSAYGRTGNLARGGAIYNNSGAVTITKSEFRDNGTSAGAIAIGDPEFPAGGAIYNKEGTVDVYDSTISFNQVATIAGLGSEAQGGAIYNTNGGTVTLQDSNLSANKASGGTTGAAGNGGAVYNEAGGIVKIMCGMIDNNESDGPAGAIANRGAILLQSVTVERNESGVSGGAIDHAGGSLEIENSTLAANRAFGGSGGAMLIQATLAVTNSTFSANTASGAGGAIATTGGAANLLNVTITDNIADANRDDTGDGGGISNRVGGVVNLHNTLVARNVDNSVVAANFPDLDGAFISNGYNLVGDGTGSSGLVNGNNGDQVGTATVAIDPRLGALVNNGGPTATHALLLDSPARDAGDSGTCPAFDQRGRLRPVGKACDIGAYEISYVVYLPIFISG